MHMLAFVRDIKTHSLSKQLLQLYILLSVKLSYLVRIQIKYLFINYEILYKIVSQWAKNNPLKPVNNSLGTVFSGNLPKN